MPWSDEERRAYQREYYHKHREKILGARTEEQKQANRDRAKKWYWENREYTLARSKQDRKKPDHWSRSVEGKAARRASQQRRRAEETPEERALRYKKQRVYYRTRYKKRRERLHGIKRDAGCKKCGERDPLLLQFHHRNPAEKSFRISAALTRPWGVLLAEIAKCDVLCLSCHKAEHQLMRYGEVEG